MIVYDLTCDGGHSFEGWFGSSEDFAAQQERGMVACPQCGSAAVGKAPMAPSVGRKGNQVSPTGSERARPVANTPMPPQMVEAMKHLAQAQARALDGSTWVGEKFVEQSRAMHYGDRDHAPIHGQASLAEARALAEEGVSVAPLPFPVAPPKELN